MFMACTSTGSTPMVWIASTLNSFLLTRHKARARVGGFVEYLLDGNMGASVGRGFFVDHDQLHATRARNFHPWINIGGVFDGGGDDAIARLPVDAVGDDADAFGSVFDEGN